MIGRHFRLLPVAVGVLLTAACSRHSSAPSATAPPPPPPSRAAGDTAEAVADGAPRVVLSADGVHIDYRVFGRGTPLIVLIHDWSCDANYWRAQIEDLSQDYTVVAVNLAGHGASSRNRTNWTMAAFGGDIGAVLDALPAGDVVLVGHSMGGAAALEAARRFPGRVIGIVGVDAFGDIGAPPRTTPDTRFEQRVAHMREDYIGATRELVAGYLFAKGANPALARRIADDMALAPPEVAIPSMIAFHDYDYGPALAGIHAPIVAISPDLHGVPDLERIRKVVPGFRLDVMPGHGHFLMMEDPAGFDLLLRKQIQAFIAAAPSAP